MPHIVYLAAGILCPWDGCGFRIELVDFQLELWAGAEFYANVMQEWGQRQEFGLIGRCPGCRKFVLFALDAKKAIDEPSVTGLPVLPDDWHDHAYLG